MLTAQPQLTIQRGQQQQKVTVGSILEIQHQNKSYPLSDYDGFSKPLHQVAIDLQKAHNQHIDNAGLLSDSFEMPSLSISESTVSNFGIKYRQPNQDDYFSTESSILPDLKNVDTSLPFATKEDTYRGEMDGYKRSQSYHGKGSVPHCVSLLCNSLL